MLSNATILRQKSCISYILLEYIQQFTDVPICVCIYKHHVPGHVMNSPVSTCVWLSCAMPKVLPSFNEDSWLYRIVIMWWALQPWTWTWSTWPFTSVPRLEAFCSFSVSFWQPFSFTDCVSSILAIGQTTDGMSLCHQQSKMAKMVRLSSENSQQKVNSF